MKVTERLSMAVVDCGIISLDGQFVQVCYFPHERVVGKESFDDALPFYLYLIVKDRAESLIW